MNGAGMRLPGADIVLPRTTTLERSDIGMTPRDPYVISMDKAVEPAGEARDDYAIFAAIAGVSGLRSNSPEAAAPMNGNAGSGTSHALRRAEIDVDTGL